MGSQPSKISASRGAAVLGMSNWSTPVEVWTKIMEENQPGFCNAHGIKPPESIENAAMRWGTAFEGEIIELAEDRLRMEITEKEQLYFHSKFDFITCHIDGRYTNGSLHEGKTTNARSYYRKWGEPGTDRIPQEYAVQVQHQMLACGADECIVSVLVFPKMVDEWETDGWFTTDNSTLHNETLYDNITIRCQTWAITLAQMGYFYQYPVISDPQAQKLILAAYEDFWNVHVLGEKPPEPKTYADIKRLFPEPKGTIIADEKTVRLSAEYNDLKSEMTALKKRQDQIKTEMIGKINREAEHPIDKDSVEAIVIRDNTGRKLHSYSKTKKGLQFR